MAEVGVTTRVQWRNNLGQFASDISEAGEGAIEDASREGVNLAAAFATKRTGRMAGEIHTIGGGASGGWATGGTPYALAQEEGASAHEIGAPGQTLGNEEDGFGPVKGPVMHPGNPAVHFMRRAYEIVAPKLLDKIRARL